MNAPIINIKCLFFTSALLALTACGSGPIDPLTAATVETQKSGLQASDFVASSDIKVTSVRTDDPESGTEFLIPKGTAVSVIETKKDAALGTLVRLGIDADVASGLPSDIWLPLDEALTQGLVQANSVEAEELLETADAGLEESIFVQVARKKMTYCYRYVKRYLLQTGQVRVYLPGVSAYQAATILPKHGFRKTGNTPRTAKNGEVCVYAGGPKGHGHIEVKRNGKWWYGYGYKTNPMKNRRFLACFKK